MEPKRALYWAAMILVPILTLATNAAAAGQAAGVDATVIIQKANAAMGCNLIGKDISISVRGLLRASSIPSPMSVKIESMGNDRWRSELDTPNEHKVTVVKGGWPTLPAFSVPRHTEGAPSFA